MVEDRERFSLAPVGVWSCEQCCAERPGVEASGGAFFGEEDVVQVGEDATEASHRPQLAFVDDLLAGFRLWRLILLRAFPGGLEGDVEAGASRLDFDGAQRAAAFGEAVGADPSGAVRYRLQDECVVAADAQDVPFYGVDAHLPDGTPVLLSPEQISGEVYATINRDALRLGELLDLARSQMGGPAWERWVEGSTPLDLHAARRLRAVYLGYRELSPEIIKNFPEPWQALWVK